MLCRIYACVHYFIRSPKIEDAQALYERVKKVAQGAALMTETELEVQFHEALCDFLPNRTLDAVCQKAFEEIGAPPFDDQDEKLAARFRATFSQEDIESVGKDIVAMGGERRLFRRAKSCIAGCCRTSARQMYGRVDRCGGRQLLRAHLTDERRHLRAGHAGTFVAADGTVQLAAGGKGTMTAAKVMALAAAELLEQPETLAAARAELNVKTGGVYHCPIPPEVGPHCSKECLPRKVSVFVKNGDFFAALRVFRRSPLYMVRDLV